MADNDNKINNNNNNNNNDDSKFPIIRQQQQNIMNLKAYEFKKDRLFAL